MLLWTAAYAQQASQHSYCQESRGVHWFAAECWLELICGPLPLALLRRQLHPVIQLAGTPCRVGFAPDVPITHNRPFKVGPGGEIRGGLNEIRGVRFANEFQLDGSESGQVRSRMIVNIVGILSGVDFGIIVVAVPIGVGVQRICVINMTSCNRSIHHCPYPACWGRCDKC